MAHASDTPGMVQSTPDFKVEVEATAVLPDGR
jgi:hypothetical protein